MSKFRIDMISEEVRREAEKIIREDMHDPRLGGTYCITRAEVTRDLRYAKMYVSILEDEKAEGVIAAWALRLSMHFPNGWRSRSGMERTAICSVFPEEKKSTL